MAPPRKKQIQPETAVELSGSTEALASPADPAAALLEAGAELADAGEPEYESPAPPEPEPEPEPEAPARHVACPLCGTEGALTQSPRHSERYATCPECDGFGEVLSGSRVAEAWILPCESCSSRGYVANPDYLAAMERAGVVRFPTPSPPNPPAPGMEWDSALGMWGYPRHNAAV